MALQGSIAIHPPLRGEWKFLRPPGHHPYAFDFVQTNQDRQSSSRAHRWRFIFGHVPSESFYCWGEKVFAPIDGKVIRVGNNWEDHPYTNLFLTVRLWFNATYRFRPKLENGRLDIRPNAGNHVMIQAKEGHIVFLAHLQNHSIVVKEGQRVDRGEMIGKVGNSGNSTAPHLHINLFDQMDDPFSSRVLPFVFTEYETLNEDAKWIRRTEAVPEVGTFVRFE